MLAHEHAQSSIVFIFKSSIVCPHTYYIKNVLSPCW